MPDIRSNTDFSASAGSVEPGYPAPAMQSAQSRWAAASRESWPICEYSAPSSSNRPSNWEKPSSVPR
jgi:hypothetical protein